ncbi:MAG: YcdB/YcdC domain-containing protein [Syntrophomonadaceae bacterium]|jgi:hypothetical protein
MPRKSKQLGICLLLAFFFTTLLPYPLLADDPAVSLEQAIQIAKKHFTIPAAYNDFHSEYSSNSQRELWRLQWQTTEPETKSMQVTVDAVTGECISMNHYRTEPILEPSAPVLSEAEARKIAEQHLKSLLPHKASSLRLVTEENLIALNNPNQRFYSFTWERYKNGIPVLGNGARIDIDCQYRDIKSYSLNWLDIPVIEASKAISKESASKIFQDEKMLNLEYFTPLEFRPLSINNKTEPRLVYLINHPSNGTINAITGKPLILSNRQWEDAGGRLANAKEMAADDRGSAGSATSFTPEEIKELEKNSQIISQGEAINEVNKWVDIPADAVLSSASLVRDGRDQNRRIWNLNWTTGSKDNYYNLYAQVDAFSAKIYAFREYLSGDYQKSDLNKDKALAIANQFIKQIEPQLFKQVKLKEDSSYPVVPLQEEYPSQYSFNYSRLVDNVVFPQEGISVTVSSKDKKVTGYNLDWYDHYFPPVSQAISSSEGNKAFLQAAPLTLCYTTIYEETSKPVLTMVYKPLPSKKQEDFSMIDAISRELLDGNGKPLAAKLGPQVFYDIKGHFAEKEISQVGKAGLMTEYGQQFRPEEAIDNITFLRNLMGAREGIYSIENIDDTRLLNLCRQRGWVKENIDLNASLTRDYMAQVLVRSMSLERVAAKPAIFINPYPDDPSITNSNLGYVALVKGLGLVPPSPSFNSDQKVTRGEVAYALVNSLKS